METLVQDLRYAFRALRRTPAVTAVAIITLALGIGANTAIFSVLRSMLWRPLPFAEPERAVMIWSHWKGWDRTWVSPPEFMDYQAATRIFSSVGAYSTASATLTADGEEAERFSAGVVTASMFDVLGVKPLMGRTFTAEEDQPNGPNVVVLGEAVWRRRYAADPAIVGKSIQINQRDFQVLGVMPESFRLPEDFAGTERTQLWLPIAIGPVNPQNRGNHGLSVTGRLAPGVELARAQAMVDDVTKQMRDTYTQNYGPEFGATLVSLPDEILGKVRPALMVLLGAVGLVLLIACGNVANLLLVRGEARQRELAIRTALGANRARMVRQLLTESVLLAVIGGGAGVILALWGVSALPAINPSSLPRAESIGIDVPVMLGTLVLAMLTGVIFGLVPAWHLLREDKSAQLRETSRSATSSAAGQRFRRVLIGAEVAVAVVLVIGAGLLMRSFARLTAIPPGFEPSGVLTMRLSLPQATYPTRTSVRNFYDQLFREVRALPGVQVAGAVAGLPLATVRGDWGVQVPGYTPPPNEGTPVDMQVVSADYFRAVGMTLKKGRFLTDDDREGTGAPVIVINEETERRYFGGQDALGKVMRLSANADSLWRTVVGVVANVHHRGLTEPARPEMYLPQLQTFLTATSDSVVLARGMSLAIKTSVDPNQLIAPVRRIITSLDRGLAVSEIRTLEDIVARSIAAPRLTATLIGVFAALALILAAVGIYGVVAYVVAQRTTEMGIRVALGAKAADVLKLVVGQGMQPVAYGLAAGVVGALVLSRLLTRLLYGISSTDATTYAGVAILLGTVALLACWLPARRASRTDPMVALRSE